MRLYSMDPKLIEIYNIRNIESIKVWDLVLSANSKELVVPAILVIYDGGKNLNLSAQDEYFDVFVKKILEVYNDEKNNILEDSLTDPFRLQSKINCDEKSATILDNGSIYDINEVYKFYRDKCAYKNSLFFQKNEARRLLGIVKYHLEEVFNISDKTVSFDGSLEGYRDNYVLEGKVNGIETIFPLSFEKLNSHEYKFFIGGIYREGGSIEVEIKFSDGGIYVLVKLGNSLIASFEYKVVDGMVKTINDIEKDGVTIKYYNGDLTLDDRGDFDNLKSLDCPNNLDWYRLPWGAMYGTQVKREDISETEKLIELVSKYIDYDEGGFISHEFYSKRYKRNNTATVEAMSMDLDELGKNVVGASIDNDNSTFVIETNFDDKSKDYYTRDKCFYHACISEAGVKGINRDDLIELGKKQEIIDKSDLANKQKIINLVRGGQK